MSHKIIVARIAAVQCQYPFGAHSPVNVMGDIYRGRIYAPIRMYERKFYLFYPPDTCRNSSFWIQMNFYPNPDELTANYIVSL
jgi:hypothetical protein